MEEFIRPLVPAIILFALVFVPLTVVVGTVLLLKRQEAREARRSPLTDKLLHQAGAQARKRVDEISESIMERLMQVMLIGPMVMLVILLPRVTWSKLHFSWLTWLAVAGAGLWIIWLTRQVVLLRRERKRWRQGMLAEIAVAQQLDRLMAQQCYVMHDIPAKDFNIDHVVVGASAVFMVETKSRRKSGAGKASAIVVYDGKTLQFPTWSESKPLQQTRDNARWLAAYLRGETGESTVVIPVLCLPGWYVQLTKDSHHGDVRVINPKMTSLFVEAGSRPRLDTAHRNRIVNALYKRYPDLDVAE